MAFHFALLNMQAPQSSNGHDSHKQMVQRCPLKRSHSRNVDGDIIEHACDVCLLEMLTPVKEGAGSGVRPV